MIYGTWEPIETAPKDGTRVLVYCSEQIGVAFWGPVWAPEDMQWIARMTPAHPDEMNTTSKALGPTKYVPGPSHWMPLPATPLPTVLSL